MYYGISGAQYALDSSPIKSGGEGNIYAILGNQSKFAKIYHPNVLDSELEAKLCTMCRNPPAQEVLTQIAWPVDVLYDSQRQFCGFLMNKLNTTHELGEIYKYPKIYKTWNELFINMAFQMTNMERLADMANIKYDKEVENIVDEKTGKKFTYTVMKIK